MTKKSKQLLIAVFIVYVIFACYVAIRPPFQFIDTLDLSYSIELNPLTSISRYIYMVQEKGLLPEVILLLIKNFTLLLPAGFLIPTIWGNLQEYKSAAIYGFIISFTKEVVQILFTTRAFQVDEIICNVCGFIVGFYIYKIYMSKQKN